MVRIIAYLAERGVSTLCVEKVVYLNNIQLYSLNTKFPYLKELIGVLNRGNTCETKTTQSNAAWAFACMAKRGMAIANDAVDVLIERLADNTLETNTIHALRNCLKFSPCNNYVCSNLVDCITDPSGEYIKRY